MLLHNRMITDKNNSKKFWKAKGRPSPALPPHVLLGFHTGQPQPQPPCRTSASFLFCSDLLKLKTTTFPSKGFFYTLQAQRSLQALQKFLRIWRVFRKQPLMPVSTDSLHPQVQVPEPCGYQNYCLTEKEERTSPGYVMIGFLILTPSDILSCQIDTTLNSDLPFFSEIKLSQVWLLPP